MLHFFLAAALAAAFVPAAAQADCAYDLKQLKVRLAREHSADLLMAVRKEMAKAEAAQKTSETECRNHVVRGWKIVRAAADQAPASGTTAAPAGQTTPKGPSAPTAPNAPTNPIGPKDNSVQ